MAFHCHALASIYYVYIYTNMARLGQRAVWQYIKEPTSSHSLHFIVWVGYGLQYDYIYAFDPTQGSVLPVIFVARGNGILMNTVHPYMVIGYCVIHPLKWFL